MARPQTALPNFSHWDSETHAQVYNGREITLFKMQKGKEGVSTTYRSDYPEPPLHWEHKPPPNSVMRPVPSFEGNTSYREAYKPWSLHNGPQRRLPPPAKFTPKLSTVTTQRNSYKEPPLPPVRPRTASEWKGNSSLPIGTTTMRADYKEHPLHGNRPRVHQVPPAKPTKFAGQTTTRESFHWPPDPPPAPVPTPKGPHVVPPFAGNTEYRQAYVPVTMPPGLKADIGVQVATRPYKAGGVGGQFELMIRKSQPVPAIASKTFTTVIDGQPTAAIVVVAKAPTSMHGVILGHFNMEGIKPAVTGVPKVEVSLRLLNERTLQASALYKNGQKTKALTFQAKTGPALRSVASVDDVPTDLFG